MSMPMRLALALLVLSSSVAAQTLTTPLPAGCVATLVQSGSNATVTCASGPTPPIPPGPITCTGYTRTLLIDEKWSGPTPRQYTEDHGGFTGTDALIVRFTTGSLTNPGKQGMVSAAEWSSPPSLRHATLSLVPCDFGPGLQPPYSAAGPSNTIQMFFSVGGNPQPGGYPVLQPNTTYYVNIMNVIGSTCRDAPTCDMFVDFSKPRGT